MPLIFKILEKINIRILILLIFQMLGRSNKKIRQDKMFHMKRSLSPNCMRAKKRSEEIQFPPKKNLLISQAVYKCFI